MKRQVPRASGMDRDGSLLHLHHQVQHHLGCLQLLPAHGYTQQLQDCPSTLSCPFRPVQLSPETSVTFFWAHKKPYIIDVHNLMSLQLSVYPWNCQHSLCPKHAIHLQNFLPSSHYQYTYNVIRTFNIPTTLQLNKRTFNVRSALLAND